MYDDSSDEYWNSWQNHVDNRSNSTPERRSQQSTTKYGGRIRRLYRSAPEPSPLLKEWMDKNGIKY